MQHRNACRCQRAVDESIACLASVASVGLVVELDNANDAESTRIAEGKVNMLAGDAVEGGLALLLRKAQLRSDDVRQANLAEDSVAGRRPPAKEYQRRTARPD